MILLKKLSSFFSLLELFILLSHNPYSKLYMIVETIRLNCNYSLKYLHIFDSPLVLNDSEFRPVYAMLPQKNCIVIFIDNNLSLFIAGTHF